MKYNIDKELMHDSSLKIQSIIILIVILCSLISAIYFYIELQSKNDVLNKTVNELTITKEILEEKEKTINNVQDSMVVLIEMLNQVNKDSALLELSRRLIEKTNNSNILIRFHAFRAGNKNPNAIYEYLKRRGYSVILFKQLSVREDWLSYEPSIFYYDEQLKSKAKEISQELANLTGINFKVTVGAGKTIHVGQEESLINIHLIGNKKSD